jgi:PAS domain S-box-containing protein
MDIDELSSDSISLLCKTIWGVSSEGMRLTDELGNTVMVNDAYTQIVQKNRRELIGNCFSDSYHPTVRKQILQMYLHDFSYDQIKPKFERETLLWNGQIVWLEFVNAKINFSDYKPLVLSIIKNITERKKAEQKLRKSADLSKKLAAHLQDIREEERKLIATEIHDELGQTLTVLKIQTSLLGKKLNPDQKELSAKVDYLNGIIDGTVETVQRIATNLRPGILDEEGIVAAIEWQAKDFEKNTGINCNTFLPESNIKKLKPQKATALFRIFQETMTNVARHSKATKVKINLETTGNNVLLEVRDNGIGINKKKIDDPSSLGILGMRERAELFSGDVEINGVNGTGTTVKIRIPLKNNRELL